MSEFLLFKAKSYYIPLYAYTIFYSFMHPLMGVLVLLPPFATVNNAAMNIDIQNLAF